MFGSAPLNCTRCELIGLSIPFVPDHACRLVDRVAARASGSSFPVEVFQLVFSFPGTMVYMIEMFQYVSDFWMDMDYVARGIGIHWDVV